LALSILFLSFFRSDDYLDPFYSTRAQDRAAGASQLQQQLRCMHTGGIRYQVADFCANLFSS
jgi:hypothetical protein